MKRLALVTVCAVALTVVSVARAEEPIGKPTPAPEAVPPADKDWGVTLGADWFSEYIFRGVDLLGNDSLYSPSVVGTYKGFTAAYVGYFGDSDAGGNTWYEEHDLSIDYTHSFMDGKFSLTAGALWYLYDGPSGADTVDLYGKLAFTHFLNPFIALSWDIDEFHGGYGVIGIAPSFDLGKAIGMEEGKLSVIPLAQLGIDFGYNSRVTDSNINWNDILLGVKVPYAITEALEIRAQFQVSVALDSLNDIGQGNERIGNIGLSYSF